MYCFQSNKSGILSVCIVSKAKRLAMDHPMSVRAEGYFSVTGRIVSSDLSPARAMSEGAIDYHQHTVSVRVCLICYRRTASLV